MYFTTPFNVTTNGLSFSVWVKTPSTSSGNGWDKIFNFGNGPNNYDIGMSTHAGASITNLDIAVLDGVSIGTKREPSYNLNDDNWHDIVWTLSYSSNPDQSTWNLYVDNVLISILKGENPLEQ